MAVVRCPCGARLAGAASGAELITANHPQYLLRPSLYPITHYYPLTGTDQCSIQPVFNRSFSPVSTNS